MFTVYTVKLKIQDNLNYSERMQVKINMKMCLLIAEIIYRPPDVNCRGQSHISRPRSLKDLMSRAREDKTIERSIFWESHKFVLTQATD